MKNEVTGDKVRNIEERLDAALVMWPRLHANSTGSELRSITASALTQSPDRKKAKVKP